MSAQGEPTPQRKAYVVVSDSPRLWPTGAHGIGALPCIDLSPQKEPRRISPRLFDRCVTARGFWGVGAVFVPESRRGEAGFRVLRPFSFVRERNPSLGWPAWHALDALLVDGGWIAEGDVGGLKIREAGDDPLFEEPVTIQGVVRKVETQEMARLWEPLTALALNLDAAPYGSNLLPIVLQETTEAVRSRAEPGNLQPQRSIPDGAHDSTSDGDQSGTQ